MDLLADSREVIRNDGLLLLQQLTKANAAIQKIVAFENAFERLLDIITEEGMSDGGIPEPEQKQLLNKQCLFFLKAQIAADACFSQLHRY
ncbi:hypothetical protein chiPu_0023298 [Chiloscyllium punctatum]|uniref:Uncharacterized protein n=1 Tax=Chiloscyllium punctatum TaxID=137246 RepID=A0A401T835_CHIPU|nr:hypothetical protein [Chiloscyllium punctatum]